ncbi:MAG: tetratricopeptide repeat protein [Betaproteobacteria bacterium]|nr:tetratricopeptide repeat protein [Betaproteobacteria bacterium]
MAYDLQEQEQIEEVKAWWKEHGRLVILAVSVAVITISALQGWRYYRHSQALAAVTLYGQLESAEHAGEHKKVRDIAQQIIARYGSTPYAAFAALSAARAGFDTGDLAGAKSSLQWAMERAREQEIKDLARMRLAGVLLDEKSYAEALKLLETKPVESMTGLYADLKGDILLAQGKIAEARSAYQLALDRSDGSSPYRNTIQLKLDALGEAK